LHTNEAAFRTHPTNPIPFCIAIRTLAWNAQIFAAQSVSDSDIPCAKAAKVGRLKIDFFLPSRLLRALRETFRVSVAAVPRWVLCG